MQVIKKWTKRILISIPVLFVLTMTLQVWSVPNYHGGRSYVSYSPDGTYRLDYVYTKDDKDSVRVFSLLKDHKVIAIAPTPSFEIIDINPSWLCGKDFPDGTYRRVPCYGHKLEAGDSDIPIIQLPPSWWQSLHAWLTIKFKDLEQPQLKIVEVSAKYPPVTKN